MKFPFGGTTSERHVWQAMCWKNTLLMKEG